MTIFVDADACPVKREIFALACQYNIKSVFVSSYDHYSWEEGMEWVYVDAEKEAVDLYIVNHAQPGDIVVTQDVGLASMLVHRDICVISPRGKVYAESEMDERLYIRHLHAKERKRGIYPKGMKRFSPEDRTAFRNGLEKILSKSAGNNI